MAVFKCKTCGGKIVPNADGFTGVCEYCGTLQTIPKDKDEKISQLLNRANDFRLSCDYDRAIFEYEKVLELDETEPEAHWGVFLSKYGVEYVRDTMTLEYKPTLHRISSVSVYDDVDYQATLKYASVSAAQQYKAVADYIELVMKELLLLSANQEPYDVFLSYKERDDVTRQRTDDSYLAHDLYNELTAQGYKVFFAPKSLIGVALYEPKIYSAIISSKVMIVLGTKPEHLEGVWVKNEWSRFAEAVENGEDKVIIPVFRNMEASQLPTRIAKYQAYNMASMTFLPSLLEAISKSVKKDSKINFNKNASAEEAFVERGFLALEDRDFRKADSFFEEALNLNPHSSQAYFGKLMIEMGVNKKEQILTSPQPLRAYGNFEKAVRFADQQLKTVLLQYEQRVQYTLDEPKYNKALSLINKEKPSKKDCLEAANIFKTIHNFKDAKQKEAFCYSTIDSIEKDGVLERAKLLIKADIIPDYEAAIKLFATIPGWRDADELKLYAINRITEIKAEKLEAERIAKEKRKVAKKRAMIITPIIAVVLVFVIVLTTVIIPNSKYNDAVELMEAGKYEEAISAFEELDGHKDSEEKIKGCNYFWGIALLKSDNEMEAVARFSAAGDFKDSKTKFKELLPKTTTRDSVSAGWGHTVGLKSDGAVVATKYEGDYYDGECDVAEWTDIVAISAGGWHTVGLKSDGTVVAVGDNLYGQCDVSEWTDIVAISAGVEHTIGLKSNGTVVATRRSYYGQSNVSEWMDIVAISAGGRHTVGLKSNGTVVAVGDNDYGQCNVSKWTDIVAVSAGNGHTVGLKSDGTVVAVGDSEEGQCDVFGWTDIVAVSAGYSHTVGLKSDGTVVATECVGDYYYGQCDVSEWTDIVAISVGDYHTIGLKSDGTVVATEYIGDYYHGQCDVSDWENIKLPENK